MACVWLDRVCCRPCHPSYRSFLRSLGAVEMNDFMQKQFDISQELIRLMNREHEERNRLFQMYETQLQDKDRQIAKLKATVEALEILAEK